MAAAQGVRAGHGSHSLPDAPSGYILYDSYRNPSMKRIACLVASVVVLACDREGGSGMSETQQRAQAYLDSYAKQYQQLFYEAQKADWASNTHIVEGDSTNAVRTKRAREAQAVFVGSVANIDTIRAYLKDSSDLTPLQRRQFAAMLYNAADAPQTVPDVVKKRIAAETEQVEKLYGFTFKIAADTVTPNTIDSLLRASTNLAQRRAAWEASKEVGKVLKPGMTNLQQLRNQTVQALGYHDFFAYQVGDYGMSTDEMLQLTDKLVSQIWPLYRELHTWARYELAKRYKQTVPEYLPADWLPNRWGQSWEALATAEGANIESAFAGKTPEWVVQQGEAFYKSLGFPALPQSFWDSSSLYALPANSKFKKNTHASAWHLDLDKDVRSLMSVVPDPDWYGTVHHELGHIYYYIAYTTPQVPLVLRGGANRAYHEGIGTMIELAASQPRFLKARGMMPKDVKSDSISQLLKEALNYIVFMPFSAGTMTRFEHSLYAENLAADQYNAKWWELAKKYQGIVPPATRGAEYNDPATKTHITDDAGQYYDYAISQALLFQLHNHIAKNILKQDPHDTDYYGNTAVGDFLRKLMAPGSSKPWRDVLKETTGSELDAQAMLDYFAPLMTWLKEQNKGRTHTLPETL
jgi:peptidyl-dipeptidase A